MALLRNIAGFEMYEGQTVRGTSSVPAPVPTTTAPPTALFNNILNIVGQGAATANPAGAIVLAVQQGVNLLPPGKLKNAITDYLKPFSLLKKFIQVFTGKKYTTGEYRLGERYLDQVVHAQGPDTIKSYRDVPDSVVPEAQILFTILFGVRITNDEDLTALSSGVTAYYQRPDKTDIPNDAVQRAVLLAQRYYPASSFNLAEWDLSHFSEYPLTAPIPDPYTVGKLYSGPLPGGGTATNGVININAETPLSSLQQSAPGQPGAAGKSNMILWLGLGLLLYGSYKYAKKEKMI